MTNRVDTEAITARLKNATPGPWHYDGYAHVSKTRGRTDMVASAHDPDDGSHCTKRSEANAQFIAAAPGDIAALLAEVARLREALGKTRTALRETLTELAGAEWDGSLADSTTCCAWCKREKPWDTPEQDEELSHDADCVWMAVTGRARAVLQAVEETP